MCAAATGYDFSGRAFAHGRNCAIEIRTGMYFDDIAALSTGSQTKTIAIARSTPSPYRARTAFIAPFALMLRIQNGIKCDKRESVLSLIDIDPLRMIALFSFTETTRKSKVEDCAFPFAARGALPSNRPG
jgi:hypothetical protein